ncbi:AAA family ATPase [bacterium]|nr:AAA family ATPase [bacterium]
MKLIFLTIAEKKKPCIIFLDEIDKILDTYKSSVYQETV